MKVIPFKSKTTPWRVVLPPSWFPNRKAKARYFRTQTQAEKFLRRCKDEGKHALSEVHDGEAPIVAKRSNERLARLVDDLLHELDGDESALRAAVTHYKKTVANIKVVNGREFVALYLAHRETERANSIINLKTYNDDHSRLRYFLTEYEQVPVTQITAADLFQFFAKQSKGSRRVIYKKVNTMFKWGKNFGYLSENPMEKIEAKKVGQYGVNKGFYTAGEQKRMLRIAAGMDAITEGGQPTLEYIDLLPWLVFSGFGALRSCEIVRDDEATEALRWTDVDGYLERGFFKVREEVAKGGETTMRNPKLVHAIEAIQAWTPHIRRRNEFVCPLIAPAFNELRQKFFKEIGIKFRKNGLRNSAGTYLWNYNNGLDDVSQFMGNSPTVAKKHYVEDLEPGLGKQWFDIRPFEAVEGNRRTA